MSWEWSRINKVNLAKFVNRKALAVLNEPVPLNKPKLELLKDKPAGREEIIKSIYEYLKNQKIQYDKPQFQDDKNRQIIRNPSEILVSQKQGTCLDLSLLFCSFCLGYGLLPLIIIIEGHAFVAVSLSLILEEWESPTSRRGILHDNGGLLAKEDGQKLETWITSGHYVAIECTGFVKANFADLQYPEARGRDSEGYLPYDRAKKAGEEQLNKLTNGSREFDFAVDIAICSCGLTEKPEDFNIVLPSTTESREVREFRQKFAEIIFSSDTDNIVPFLGPGINPEFYLNLASSLENICLQLDCKLREKLMPEMIVTPCKKCGASPGTVKYYCPEIMEGKNFCSTYHEQNIAETRMKIRRFSQMLYNITRLPNTFYAPNGDLRKIIEKEMLTSQNNQIYHSLSTYKGNNQVLPYQLIVTTNVDNILEKALESQGRNYDLVYFVADGKDRGKYKHKPQGKPAQTIDIDQKNLNLPIYNGYGGTNTIPNSHTIILKLYGDWQDCFLITRDHFDYFLDNFIDAFPAILKSILCDKSLLFLGYSPSNSLELQTTINALHESGGLSQSNFLLHHQSFVSKVDEKFWEKKQVTLTSLEDDWSLENFIACMNKTEEN